MQGERERGRGKEGRGSESVARGEKGEKGVWFLSWIVSQGMRASECSFSPVLCS